MRVLVDEGMPVQVLPPLRLNKQHEFDHIGDLAKDHIAPTFWA
jgi:hypothetical protein